ncbi:MAG TPA: DUF1961 family protein [Pyrinomonadaceae bacterium]|nr:DUF1961 family protein [Pyrinomonadaceae bacterium]
MDKGKLKIILVVVFFVFSTAVFAQESEIKTSPVIDAPIDISKYKLKKVYENDFSKKQKIAFEKDFIKQNADGSWTRTGKPDKQAEWIAEGLGGVDVKNGKLRASPVPLDASGNQIANSKRSHLVIWNKNIFPDNFLLEFEMNPNSSTSGLTIVFFCATGKNGEDIFDLNLPPRQADYKTYHSGAIANYSDSYFSRNTEIESITNRLRKNVGFKLVAEGKSLTTGSTDVTHHIRILKVGGHIEIEINGKIIFKWIDAEKPLGAGRIGLRSMEGVSMITYDNFKVWKVSTK